MIGGVEMNGIFGVNWYMNLNICVMFNCVFVDWYGIGEVVIY